MKKIYFSGSISGGRNDVDFYYNVINFLKNNNCNVLTEHIGNKNLGNNGENFADDYIYLRDCNWIIEADYVIAEVTTPSLGVGYEICYAQNLHKPILCLFNSNSDRRLSAMINGNKNLIVHKYNSIEQAYKFISDFIN